MKARFNEAIVMLTKDKDQNHKLLFLEEFILLKAKDKTKTKKEIFDDCFQFLRNYNIQLKNEARNYETEYAIKQIHFPKEKKSQKNIQEMQKKLKLKNQADEAILALFIYHSKKQEYEEGIFLTFDFHDFLVNAKKIEKLKAFLKTDTPDLVLAMIHKFQERELHKDFPVLNNSPNILIMIDEAHRTQYKLLGANLSKSLPNAIKIAFTGTPIEKTEMTFGDYIDKYSIKQAVNDNITVGIIYEGRVHRAELQNEEEANKKFQDVFSMLEIDEKARIMGRYTWRAYLEAEEVIKDKADDMLNHYLTHIFPNGFKAQIVTVSRLAAIRYKKTLEEMLIKKIDELEKNNTNVNINLLRKLKVGIVISGQPNDPPEYHPFTDEKEHERIIKSFKHPFEETNKGNISGDIGILVVQSMLITGFDAPVEQVMYLDNVIKGHNLLQAIARVNRVYKNKSCGYIVDYVGVLKHLRKALGIYADSDIREITLVVKDYTKSIDDLRYAYNCIVDFFNAYEVDNWRDNLDECVAILDNEKVRNEFLMLIKRFNKAMDIVLPKPEASKYIPYLKALHHIKEAARTKYRDNNLGTKDASKKIREIIEGYLISKGINPKIPPIPLFDERFLERIEKKSSKARGEELKYAIIEYIEKHYETDPELYERFSDKLKKILEEYKCNWDILAFELEKIREELKKGREDESTYIGLDPKKEMPFFGLLKQEIFGKKNIQELSDEMIDFLVGLTKKIVKIIQKEIQVIDFWENYTKQKKLKSLIISQLLKAISPQSQKKSVKKEKSIVIEKNAFFSKRNEIAQRLMELTYHIYGM